jgi:SAM-dependent methyltransferase
MKLIPDPPLLLLRRLVVSIESSGVRGAMVRSYRRLARSLSNHGLGGTLDRAFHTAPVAASTGKAAAPDPFDLRYGTDTAQKVFPESLPDASLSSLYLSAYLAVAASAVTGALTDLKVEKEKFTFVDLGCGKGRALLVAAGFPFRGILGVELAPALCEVARANIAMKPEWASRITVINEDAAKVTYPETPLVVFLFSPFFAPVLRRVLANLERQLRRAPRETYLLYANNPRITKVLKRFPFLREVSETSYLLSPEEAAADPSYVAETSVTLYSVDLTR